MGFQWVYHIFEMWLKRLKNFWNVAFKNLMCREMVLCKMIDYIWLYEYYIVVLGIKFSIACNSISLSVALVGENKIWKLSHTMTYVFWSPRSAYKDKPKTKQSPRVSFNTKMINLTYGWELKNKHQNANSSRQLLLPANKAYNCSRSHSRTHSLSFWFVRTLSALGSY